MQNRSKNNAEGFYSENRIDSDTLILKYRNQGGDIQQFKKDISSYYIQFHFCLRGSGSLSFNDGNYRLPIREGQSYLLYNPEQELPLDLSVGINSEIISLLVPIEEFHGYFSKEASYISFLSDENKHHKYYKDGSISPAMAVVLNQIMNQNIHPSVGPLYFKGKLLELLSLYFNLPAEADLDKCPFLADEDNVSKVKRAKEIIIARMAEPPTLQELSDEINLPLNKLKQGFKQIYGDSVFSFLLDYKLELARQLLADGSYNVNEVGLKLGYSTASHFISAFKKKYGITPKKFTQGLTV